MKYKFANYEFDNELRLLRLPDGTSRHLRLKVNKLLSILLSRPQKVFTKEELIEQIWGEESDATDHDLQGLKGELDKALKDKTIVKTVSGEGYAFNLPVTTPQDIPIAIGSSNDKQAILPVFPGLGTPAGALFVHSFVGYGSNDRVQHIQKKVKWERRLRHMVMQSADTPETILIPFRHTVRSGEEGESWWNVILAIRVDPVSGKWQTVDLTEYKRLSFEVRSNPARAFSQHTFIPFRMRLEDSTDSEGTNRQSTNWYPHLLIAPKHFIQMEVLLDEFWSPGAGPIKSQNAARNRIFQIVFGQDSTIPSIAGTLEIRKIKFTP
jgi:DNA-binding winged helix-turn-helix (wHTH) protein